MAPPCRQPTQAQPVTTGCSPKRAAAVGAIVDRAEASLEHGSTRDAVLARVRQDMLKLYEDEATSEVGDTDVCEQVAADLTAALVAHDQQPIIACDEILE
jgi:hypothetical protein